MKIQYAVSRAVVTGGLKQTSNVTSFLCDVLDVLDFEQVVLGMRQWLSNYSSGN